MQDLTLHLRKQVDVDEELINLYCNLFSDLTYFFHVMFLTKLGTVKSPKKYDNHIEDDHF